MGTIMKAIFYSSRSNAFDMQSAKELGQSATKYNTKHGITGFLFFNKSRYFLQYIEGESREVTALFERIKNDPRHTISMTIIDENCQQRRFPNWNMQYVTHEQFTHFQVGFDNILVSLLSFKERLEKLKEAENTDDIKEIYDEVIWHKLDDYSRFTGQFGDLADQQA